jgi:hypothetical protein
VLPIRVGSRPVLECGFPPLCCIRYLLASRSPLSCLRLMDVQPPISGRQCCFGVAGPRQHTNRATRPTAPTGYPGSRRWDHREGCECNPSICIPRAARPSQSAAPDVCFDCNIVKRAPTAPTAQITSWRKHSSRVVPYTVGWLPMKIPPMHKVVVRLRRFQLQSLSLPPRERT